jgi:hypothetical protein
MTPFQREVVDDDVDVHLLGAVLAWPLRGPELGDGLEADALVTCRVAHLAPSFVGGRFPFEQGAVEVGESARVVTIKDKRWKACNGHESQRTPGCGQIQPGISTNSRTSLRQHVERGVMRLLPTDGVPQHVAGRRQFVDVVVLVTMPTNDDTPQPDPIDEEAAQIDARDPDVAEKIEALKEDATALGRDVEGPPL